jgi:ABC-type branched-subunit amino acid transport system substrate-binding protein
MRYRLFIGLLALGLVAGACSSDRGDDPAGDATDGTTATDGTAAAGGEMFGTLPSPCGEGEPGALPTGGEEGDTQGITDDSIAVGTISDPGFSGAPGLNQEIFDAGEAFVTWCNEQGGINGREIDLTQYDAAITDYQPQLQAACGQELAIVGDGAVQDNFWATIGVECGLIDIAGFAVTPEKAGTSGPGVTQETRVVQPVPNPSDRYPAGAIRMVNEEHPGAIDHVGILYGDLATTAIQKDRIVEATEAEGGTVVYEAPTNILGEANWAPFAQAIQDAGVEWLVVVGAGEATGALQAALSEIDYHPEVTLLETNFYDPIYLESAGANGDGTLIRMVFTPFEEADENPATARYIELVEAVDGKVALLGAQSMSAWLLFATAAKECDDAGNLSRSCILETAGSVTEWDGGGLHAVTDPSTNSPSPCTMLVEIQGGEFVRNAPDEGFDCDDSSIIELQGDYSTSG